jgi:hypothetical protein
MYTANEVSTYLQYSHDGHVSPLNDGRGANTTGSRTETWCSCASNRKEQRSYTRQDSRVQKQMEVGDTLMVKISVVKRTAPS